MLSRAASSEAPLRQSRIPTPHCARDGVILSSVPEATPLERLRALCLSFPETSERLSHGEPTFFVREKKTFVMYDNYHHNAAHCGFWCAAPPGAQEILVGSAPERFFRPPYVGHRGWLGVYLDVPLDWDEIAGIVADAYRTVAPAKLVAQLDAGR